jgi:tRNA modification GTPase
VPVSDTIVALSTPPGHSGIGVIRLSGAHALELTRKLLRKDEFSPKANRVTLQTIHDPESGEALDQALITYFQTPHSFTGEDVVELSCHGSPVLLLNIVDALLLLGARAANAGEFTLRALSHGRLNLSQAEAIRDLIDAQTHAAVLQAARQLGGELSARLQPIKDALLDIIVPLESSLEFVEDDLPDIILTQISQQLLSLIQRLDDLADTFGAGRLLKEGLKVVLVGRPNVGKSSIFNGLLCSDRAIVTDIPGTTRDSLNELISVQGIPVLLTDTAGVRTSDDVIEAIGIERTKLAMVDADLIVVVLDGTQSLTIEDHKLLADVRESKYLIALNKCDLETFSLSNIDGLNGTKIVPLSAKTGVGLETLLAAISEPFNTQDIQEANFFITNARHYDLLRRAAGALHSSKNLLETRVSEDLILLGLYDTLRYLGELTGETTPENVLSQIFSTFCIGK